VALMRTIGWILGLLGLMALGTFGLGYGFIDGDLPLWLRIVGGSGALMISAWIWMDWNALSDLGKDASTGRYVTAVLAVLLGAGILVTANVAAYRSTTRWDVTKNKQYTLSDQSVELVKKLDREITVAAFFQRGVPDEQNFRDLMSRYQEHTSLLKVEYHDPHNEPMLAEKMKITTDTGTVILSMGEKEQRLEFGFDEQAVTNAIVKLSSDTEHAICSITGHGEMDSADEQSADGFGFAKTKLEGQNYRVETLGLDHTPDPAHCEVVILPGPKTEVLPQELDHLAQYVAGGGSVIALVDPTTPLNVANDFARYGMQIGNDVVLEADPARSLQGNPFAIILDQDSMAKHALTEKLKGKSIFFLARSIAKGPDLAGITVTELAHSSEQSWGETDLNDTTEPVPDPGKDRVSNVPLMAVAEISDPSALRTQSEGLSLPTGLPGMTAAAKPEAPPPPAKAGGKMVVFGSTQFVSNQMLVGGINQDLLLNAVAWMVGEEDQISIRANEAGKGKLEMSAIDQLLSVVTSCFIMPILTIMGAVGTWLHRRRL